MEMEKANGYEDICMNVHSNIEMEKADGYEDICMNVHSG